MRMARPKPCRSFLLHFGDNFGVYVVVQIRVLLTLIVADRVWYRERQFCDNQQGYHIAGKVDALPAGAGRKQHAVAGFFELLNGTLPPLRHA